MNLIGLKGIIVLCSLFTFVSTKNIPLESSATVLHETPDDVLNADWIRLLKKERIHDRHKKWEPRSVNRTREDWLKKYGTTSDVIYDAVLDLVTMCKKLILLKNNTVATPEEISKFDIFLFGTLPTLEQARECVLDNGGNDDDMEDIIERVEDYFREEDEKKERKNGKKGKKDKRSKKNKKRNKRKFGNAKKWFKKNSRSKRAVGNVINLWELPIVYKYGGGHNEQDQIMIDTAIATWESETCIRFREAANNETVDHQHILFTASSRCFSQVGMAPIEENFPQQLNLQSGSCTANVGTAIHELGHSLGLVHEHSRSDRDKYIYVYYGAIPSWYRERFAKSYENPDLRTSIYDFNSIMHYGSMAYRLSERYNSIYTRDAKYRTNVGQRSQLSFLDAKRVNDAYCADSCAHAENVAYCSNGGYPDPNECTKCKCPEGMEGYGCLNPVVVASGGCSEQGTLYTTTDGSERCVSSRNGGIGYTKGDACGIKLRTLEGQRIRYRFVGYFGIYVDQSVCQHWLEIKYGPNYAIPGARYCGRRTPYTPTGYFDTPTEEMYLNFNAKYPAVTNAYSPQIPANSMVGFKLCYKMIDGPATTTSTTTTTSSTTTKPTTTTTTHPSATTTTKAPTTTVTTTIQGSTVESSIQGSTEPTSSSS